VASSCSRRNVLARRNLLELACLQPALKDPADLAVGRLSHAAAQCITGNVSFIGDGLTLVATVAGVAHRLLSAELGCIGCMGLGLSLSCSHT
jgi:hypothetical protein